jgi:4-hydroxy-2-oxoheptanedioate aldolase
MLFIGPSDLSLGLGHPGDLEHPAVADAIDRVVRSVTEAQSVSLGIFARDAGDAIYWEAKGARLILLGSTILIAQRFREVGQEIKNKSVRDD